MDIRKKMGARIHECRKAQSLSIKELSEKIGSLSAARISNWENGTRSPGPSEAILLAKALNVAASYLLCLSDNTHGELHMDQADLPKYAPIIPLADANKSKKALDDMLQNMPLFSAVDSKLSVEYKSKETAGDYVIATSVADNSMSPKFLRDDIVIVDFERKPKPGDIVLAHIANTKENVIRKYKESDQQSAKNKSFELIALNSDWGIIRVTNAGDATILGTVIEHRAYF